MFHNAMVDLKHFGHSDQLMQVVIGSDINTECHKVDTIIINRPLHISTRMQFSAESFYKRDALFVYIYFHACIHLWLKHIFLVPHFMSLSVCLVLEVVRGY